jgi:hypothetical protein
MTYVTTVTTPASVSPPIWVNVVGVMQVVLTVALLALAVYAGWKALLWLRRSRTPKAPPS